MNDFDYSVRIVYTVECRVDLVRNWRMVRVEKGVVEGDESICGLKYLEVGQVLRRFKRLMEELRQSMEL